MRATYVDKSSEAVCSRRDTLAEREDVRAGRQFGEYIYHCVECVAKENNVTAKEAIRLIKQPRREKDFVRVEKYKDAKAHIQEVWKFLAIEASEESEEAQSATSTMDLSSESSAGGGGLVSPESGRPDPSKSKKQIKKETRRVIHMRVTKVKDIFAPIMHLLALKEKDEVAAVSAAERFQKWLSNKNNKNDLEADLKMGDELEMIVEETMGKQRSFLDHADPAAMRRAADYSDQWFKHDTGAFNVYYICKAGGTDYPCNTLILSDDWDRLHAEPDAVKQRWYCPVCHTRYKTKFGVLTEILDVPKASAYYALAEFPPDGLKDVKMMAIEEKFKHCSTPQELLASLPKIVPWKFGTLLHPAGPKGAWHIDMKQLEGLAHLSWYQLYNLRNA